MVERLKGPTPTGERIPTSYILSRIEAIRLVERAGIVLEPGHDLASLVQAEIAVKTGWEWQVEEILQACGLEIHNVGQG